MSINGLEILGKTPGQALGSKNLIRDPWKCARFRAMLGGMRGFPALLKERRGHGTIDNWTGATMAVNLYQAMQDADTEATYIFMAFGRENDGLYAPK